MPELMTWVGFILTGNRYPNHELRWPVCQDAPSGDLHDHSSGLI